MQKGNIIEMKSLKTLFYRQTIFIDLLFLTAIIGLFFLLKSYGLHPAMSDENIYFYDAWLMHNGIMPYRDFFFAHPPFHLIPGWIMINILGDIDINAMKLLPDIAAFATASFIYLIVRKTSGRFAALLAAALFLFSHDLLRASSHWTAINWAVMWMSAGFFFALEKKPFISGLMLGLGVSTGIYIVPGAIMIAGMFDLRNPKELLRYLGAFLLSLLLINGYFLIIAADEYFRDIISFHLMKKSVHGSSFLSSLWNLLFHNFFLLSAPLYLLPLLIFQIKKGIIDSTSTIYSTTVWSIIIFTGYTVFLIMLSRVFHYYYLLLFPFAAISAGLFIGAVVTVAKMAYRDLHARTLLLFTILTLMIGTYIYPKFETMLPYYQTKAGQTFQYASPVSKLPVFLQKLITGIFWNKERHIGDRYTGIQYYLWHESRIFDVAEAVAKTLRDNADKDDTIFGDSTSTPLVAILSGVPIVDNFVDTNTMRFSSGETDPTKAIKKLKKAMSRQKQHLNWILINTRRGIGKNREFIQFFQKEFRPFKAFKSRYFGTYLLLKAK